MGVYDNKRKKHSRHSSDPSLMKIILGIILLGGAALGVMRFSEWFGAEEVAGEVKVSTQDELARVEALLAEDKSTEAREALAPILAKVDDDKLTPKALILKAELELDAGQEDAALENLRRAYEGFPGNPDQPRAGVRYAGLLEKRGKTEEALAIFETINERAPAKLRAGAVAGLARQLERDGELIAARDKFAEAVELAEWNSRDWNDAAAGLGRMNVKLIFSPEPTPESKVYTVVSGDSLTNIGIKLNTTQGLLMLANNMDDPNTLRLNQNLKYTPKDFRIIIERSTCRLYLMDNNGLFKVYRTGLGKPGNITTLGKYKIGNKEQNPTWFKPGSAPIPPLDPRNELGTRWMPMVPEASDLPSDLGIHGTIQPDSIGKYESMGCPRMLKEDVEELYDLVVRSTPVTVVETYDPELSAG